MFIGKIMNLNTSITFFTKSNSKEILDLNVKHVTEISREKWENLHGLGFTLGFLDITPKAWSIKKLHFIKIRYFCSVKDIVGEMSSQSLKWKK